MGVVLIGEFEVGVRSLPCALYYKCETCNKNRREGNAEIIFRESLSFLLFSLEL